MKITQKQLAAMESAGTKVTRSAKSTSPRGDRPKRDTPTVPSGMAAMSASLAALRDGDREHQKATHALIAQSAEAIRMLGDRITQMRSKPQNLDFEIERDDSVSGEYKPIKRVRVRTADL